MTENILIAVTFLFGMLVFALVLALAGIAWCALRLMRACERYRAGVARARAASRRRRVRRCVDCPARPGG